MDNWFDYQNNDTCSVKGCTKTTKNGAKGLCPMHYRRWRLYGDPNITIRSYQYGRNKCKHPLYSVWRQMIMRCYHASCPAYCNYGKRGITVCEEWRGPDGFWNFVKDMAPRPGGRYKSGRAKYTLDRIDNSKGYYKKNCRWANAKEQAQNTRQAVYVTIYGDKYCLTEACRMFSIHPSEIINLKTSLSKYGYERTLEEAFAQKLINKFKGGLAKCTI